MSELNDGVWIRFKGDVTDLMSKVDAAAAAVSGMGSKITGQLGQIADSINWSKLSYGAVSLGEALTNSISKPLGEIKDQSLQAFAGFEQAMNRVQAMSGSTKQGLSELNEEALKLGSTTQFSATKVAQAMGDLASAGLNVNEIYKAVPGILDLAAAGQIKMTEAAKVATNIMHEFGMSAQDMPKVADTIAYAAAKSSAEVSDMATAFQYFGPIARVAGISMQQTAAAFEIMADAGVRGSKAGTAMRQMIADLENPSRKAQEALEGLGIAIKDASGNLLPLDQLIGNLAPLTENTAEGFAIFGKRFSDVLSLLQAGPEKFKQLTDDVQNAGGAASQMAATLMQGYSGELKRFTDEVESMKVKIGNAFAPASEAMLKNFAEPIVKAVGDIADGFTKLPPIVQQVGLAFGTIAQWAGPAIVLLGQIGLAWPVITAGAGLLAQAGISLATTFTMYLVPALTLVGNATAIAAAAFAGWQVGTWLYNNVAAIRAFGDSLSAIIEKIPLLGRFASWATGLTAATKQASDAQAQLAASVSILEARLAAHGITVDKAGLSTEQYAQKLRDAAAASLPITVNTEATVAATVKLPPAYDAAAKAASAAMAASQKHAQAAQAAAQASMEAQAKAAQLAQAIGLAGNEVQGVLSKIPTAINAMMQALAPERMNIAGPFTQMDAAIKSIEGEIARLTPMIANDMTGAIKGMVLQLVLADDQMRELRANAEAWKAAVDEVDKGFETLDASIKASGEHTADFSHSLDGITTVAVPGFREMDSSIQSVKGSIGQAGMATDDWGTKVDKFGKQFNNMVANDLGKGITDAILGMQSLGKVFEDIGKKILEQFISTVLKELFKNLDLFHLSLSGLETQIKGLYDGIVRLFGGINSAFSGGSQAASGIGGAAGGAAGAGSEGAGSFIPGVNMISSLVSAVANVVNAIQGHQMGIDIGRIEVTTRGMLAQLLAMQGTMNQWLPFLKNTQDLMFDVKTISYTVDQIRGTILSGSPGQTYSLLDLRNALVPAINGIAQNIDALNRILMGGTDTNMVFAQINDAVQGSLDVLTQIRNTMQTYAQQAISYLHTISDASVATYNQLGKLGNGVQYLVQSSSQRQSTTNVYVQSSSNNPYNVGQQIAGGLLSQTNARI